MTTQIGLLPSKSKVERELDSTRTYQQIRKIIQAAEALKLLGRDVAEVKQKAEWVILIGNRRIGEEIRKVPKAESRDSGSGRFTPAGKPVGRGALGIPGTSRSRLQKLADIGRDELKSMVKELWEAGKDATVKSILGEAKEDEITQKRADFEKRRDKGARVTVIIFNVEGTLIDSVMATVLSWRDAFSQFGYDFTVRRLQQFAGTNPIEMIRALLPTEDALRIGSSLLEAQRLSFQRNHLETVKPSSVARILLERLKRMDYETSLVARFAQDDLRYSRCPLVRMVRAAILPFFMHQFYHGNTRR